MVDRRVWAMVVGGVLLLANPPSVRADDASAFAASTVADMLAHGTEVERLWGRHVFGQLSAVERTRVLDWIGASKGQSQDNGGTRRAPCLPDVRVSLRLRYYLASRERLRELGVDLQGLDRDSPPYPSEDERRAGSPMLEARPDVDVLSRLHEAIEDGRLRLVGSAESEDQVGAVQTLSVLGPADETVRGEQGALPTGAVICVQPYFSGLLRMGSLSIRRIVATRLPEDEDRQLQILGSRHHLDPSWGLHVGVRHGEVLLLSPRWAVGRAWTGDALPVLELTFRALPQPWHCEVVLPKDGDERETLTQKCIATLGEVRDEGARVVFTVTKADRPFFGERLTVARGADRRQYVTVIEVVGIRGTRIEARSVPGLEKHRIEVGDHVLMLTGL